jgi:hypothetical protein
MYIAIKPANKKVKVNIQRLIRDETGKIRDETTVLHHFLPLCRRNATFAGFDKKEQRRPYKVWDIKS